MAAPTILAQGTPEQAARHVTPILEGRNNWCQLFSQPGAGSDLAGLTTRAERDGDRWIINGQKVWSSLAHLSNWGMLLARTNFDVPKHRGISWFAFSLDQPGVTVRPLRESTGEVMFNEVFFDDAVVRRRRSHRRRGQRLGRDPDDAALRAHRHRRRWRPCRLPHRDRRAACSAGGPATPPGTVTGRHQSERRRIRGPGEARPDGATTHRSARTSPGCTPTRSSGSGTPSGPRPRRLGAAARRSPTSARSPRPGS